MKIVLLLSALFIQCMAAATPIETLEEFRKSAQAKNLEEVLGYLAKYDISSDRENKFKYHGTKNAVDWHYIKRNEYTKFEIIEEKIDEDMAIVIVNANKSPTEFWISHFALIKQDNEWRIFYSPDVVDLGRTLKIPENKELMTSAQRLGVWYGDRVKQIKKDHTPNSDR